MRISSYKSLVFSTFVFVVTLENSLLWLFLFKNIYLHVLLKVDYKQIDKFV
ncbi:hypothetical protein HALO156_170011 [Halomonas sp. 156]|nr:hypothetical protein HALO156_170011 [Halomonas sp. 156]